MKNNFTLEAFSTKDSYVRFNTTSGFGHTFEVFINYKQELYGNMFMAGADADKFPCWKELRGQSEQLLNNLKFYSFPFLWFISSDGVPRVMFLDSRRVHMIASLLGVGSHLPVDVCIERSLDNQEALEALLLALGFSFKHAVIALGAAPDQPGAVFYVPQDVCHRLLPILDLSSNHMCLYHIALSQEGCAELLGGLLKI